MTELEKMRAGELYNAADPELRELRLEARRLTYEFNQSHPDEPELREELLRRLFRRLDGRVEIEPPFHCDYGFHIEAGDGLYMNFGCVILDVCPVTIGERVMMGPGVQILTATHPVELEARKSGLEFGKPITIGNDVWIGGGAIILPGVEIGDGAVIGSGAVVVKNVPGRAVVVGNPARVLTHK